MKLKQVFEASLLRTKNPYGRDDMSEPEYDEGPKDTTRTIAMPYTLGDGSIVTLKIDVVYQDFNDSFELHDATATSVVLPSGREVEIDVAREQLMGRFGDEFADPEVFGAAQDYLETELGSKQKAPMPKAQFAKTEPAVGTAPVQQVPAKV